jgi:hypothetical protein
MSSSKTPLYISNLSLILQIQINFLKCVALGPSAPLFCENGLIHSKINFICGTLGPLAPSHCEGVVCQNLVGQSYGSHMMGRKFRRGQDIASTCVLRPHMETGVSWYFGGPECRMSGVRYRVFRET